MQYFLNRVPHEPPPERIRRADRSAADVSATTSSIPVPPRPPRAIPSTIALAPAVAPTPAPTVAVTPGPAVGGGGGGFVPLIPTGSSIAPAPSPVLPVAAAAPSPVLPVAAAAPPSVVGHGTSPAITGGGGSTPGVDIAAQITTLSSRLDYFGSLYSRRIKEENEARVEEDSVLKALILREQTSTNDALSDLNKQFGRLQALLLAEESARTTGVHAVERLVESGESAVTTALGTLDAKADAIAASVETEKNAMTVALGALDAKADAIAASVATETGARTAALGTLDAKADAIAASVETEKNAMTAALGTLDAKADAIAASVAIETAARNAAISSIKSEILSEVKNQLNPYFAMLCDFETYRSTLGCEGVFQRIEARIVDMEKLSPDLNRDLQRHTETTKNDLSRLVQADARLSAEYARAVSRITALEHALGGAGTTAGGGAASGTYTICIDRLDGLESTVAALCPSDTVTEIRSKLDEHVRKCDETRTLVDLNIETLKNIARVHSQSSGKVDLLEASVTALNDSMKTADATISGLSSTVNGHTEKVNSLATLNLEERVRKLEGNGADEADNMRTSINILSDGLQKIENKLVAMDQKIDRAVSVPSMIATPAAAMGDLLTWTPGVTEGDGSPAAVDGPLPGALGAKPEMASIEPFVTIGGGGGTSVLDCETSFDAEKSSDTSSCIGKSSAESDPDGEEMDFDVSVEDFTEERANNLKKHLDVARLRNALSRISTIVFEKTRKADDFSEDEIEWAYKHVIFPVIKVKAPFPAKISVEDPLDESWFQGSASDSMDAILCSFSTACKDGFHDADYMTEKIWPMIVSQLLTYDADFTWTSQVRNALLEVLSD